MRYRLVFGILAGIAGALLATPVGAAEKRTEKDNKVVIVRGRITRIRPDDQRLTVQMRDRQALDLRVDSQSRLEVDGQAVQLGQFKEGTRVRVSYEPRGGENRVVAMTPTLVGSGKIKQEVFEALRAARGYGYRQKEEFQRRAEASLHELDERIQDLQERAEGASPEVKRQLAQTVEELRRKQDVVREKLARLKDAGMDSWQDLRSGASEALDDLQRSYERSRSRFK